MTNNTDENIQAEFKSVFGIAKTTNPFEDEIIEDISSDNSMINILLTESLWDKVKKMSWHQKTRRTDFKVIKSPDELTAEDILFINEYANSYYYECNCKCDLKECDSSCKIYFELQDCRPHRTVDINIPELKYLSQEQRYSSYKHFQKMLRKRNRNPYYFFKYLFSKIKFCNKIKNLKNNHVK